MTRDGETREQWPIVADAVVSARSVRSGGGSRLRGSDGSKGGGDSSRSGGNGRGEGARRRAVGPGQGGIEEIGRGRYARASFPARACTVRAG